MLEVIKKNKKSIAMMILFGIVGVLIIPVILGVEKFSKKYPKTHKRITLSIYCIIVAVCIFFVVKQQMIYLLPILI